MYILLYQLPLLNSPVEGLKNFNAYFPEGTVNDKKYLRGKIFSIASYPQIAPPLLVCYDEDKMRIVYLFRIEHIRKPHLAL